jgi:phosphate uptake regulator
MADHAVNIAHNRLELTLSIIDETLLTELKKLSEFALDIFESAMASVFNESYDEADRILDMAQNTRKMEAEILHTIVKHSPPEEVPALRLIVESILRTAEYGADIAETVLNMMVREAVKEA